MDREGTNDRSPERRFIARNEGFRCMACGADVPKARTGYRNHCPVCLTGRHMDRFPGDRAETCRSIMDPVGAFQDHGEWVIRHRCRTCGAERNNMVAADDSRKRLAEISAASSTR